MTSLEMNTPQHGPAGSVRRGAPHRRFLYPQSDEFWPAYANNWRLEFNKERRGDVSHLHGVGPRLPAARHPPRRPRMTTLGHGHQGCQRSGRMEEDSAKRANTFANGDHTMTMIRTANGKTIQIQHDVVNPRPWPHVPADRHQGFANKYSCIQYAFEPEQLDSATVPTTIRTSRPTAPSRPNSRPHWWRNTLTRSSARWAT